MIKEYFLYLFLLDIQGQRGYGLSRCLLNDISWLFCCCIEEILSYKRACIHTRDVDRSCGVGIEHALIVHILDTISSVEVAEVPLRQMHLLVSDHIRIHLDHHSLDRQYYLEKPNILPHIHKLDHRYMSCKAHLELDRIGICLIDRDLSCLRIDLSDFIALCVIESYVAAHREYSSGDDGLFRRQIESSVLILIRSSEILPDTVPQSLEDDRSFIQIMADLRYDVSGLFPCLLHIDHFDIRGEDIERYRILGYVIILVYRDEVVVLLCRAGKE